MKTNFTMQSEDIKKEYKLLIITCLYSLCRKRFVDIKALKWQNIKTDRLEIIQAKTKRIVETPLNDNTKQFLTDGGQDTESVFNLPNHNATVKTRDYRAKRAGIEKHITFHCARHTFGQNSDPYENAIAERINGILKQEFMTDNYHLEFALMKKVVSESIKIYNDYRPHLSNHMLTPNKMHLQNEIKMKTYKTKKQ